MGAAQNKLKKRTEAVRKINLIFDYPEMVNVIHYSCERFDNNPTNGLSPRITSIAVRNLDSGQTVSFSIHQIAEMHKIGLIQIEAEYDMLETEMLNRFYEFVQRHSQYKWLHWNMRDTKYGFPAIAHRYSVLKSEVPSISFDDSKLFDLARILTDKYGTAYIDHPRLEQLMALNNISAKDVLPGEEEPKAFEQKEYIKLHQSTLRKVDVIANVAERAWNGSLKTKATWREEYGTSVLGAIEKLQNTALFTIIAFIAIIYGLIEAIEFLVRIFSSSAN